MVEDFKNKKELITAYKVGNISRELLEALASENNWHIKGIENMPKNHLDKSNDEYRKNHKYKPKEVKPNSSQD